MTWGHQLDYLEALRDDMGIMPKALADRPERHELGLEIDAAFNTLSSSRAHGMGGPLPISIADMRAYCELFEITAIEERAQFVWMMQRLDGAFLEVIAARIDKTSKADGPTSAAPPG